MSLQRFSVVKFLCLAFFVVLSFGCGESRRTIPTMQIRTDTPEGKFDWVMQRLERAVLDFSPVQRAGLHFGRRNVTHQLFPPTEERAHYTAVVKIQSEAAYVHDKPLEVVDKEKERQKRRQAMRRFNQQAGIDDPDDGTFDPLANKFTSQIEDLAAETEPLRVRKTEIETPRVEDIKEYELAYLDERWQLQTEVETDYERLWFEYALQLKPDTLSR